MDHPFTPPSRIPSLPTPKKEKKKAETYFTIPQTSSAHLTDDELQQLTRSSLELTRPVFSRSHSRESRSGSRSSGYDRLYGRDGRSGSVSAIPVHTSSSAGLTGLEFMQASYSSAALQHPQPYPKVSKYLTGHLPLDSCAVSSNASLDSASPNGDMRGGLQGSMDGPSAPAPTSNSVGAQHLTGSDLHLPPDEIPASVGHLIGAADLDLPASVTHLIGADLKLPHDNAPAIQSPYPVPPHTIDELDKSASVAALLLERMDTPSPAHIAFLPLDDSLAPTPPPLPTRKESVEVVYQSFEIVTNTTVSYEAPTPPSVIALISNLGNQGDASSDPNWPLPARTPVYTFIPPPPSGSPIASSLEASIPSNIPSPVGSPITASQRQPMQSFIPPPSTLPTVVSELSATQQPAAYSMIPPPHDIATSVAPYNQSFSATPKSMAPSNQGYQPGFSTAETSLDPNSQSFVMPASHYQESAVAAAREAWDQPAKQDEGRVQMRGRFPTGDSVRTIVNTASRNSPMPTSIAPYSQPREDPVQYPTAQYQADPEAVAAARAAYVHPSRSRTASTVLYNQPHIQESSPMPRAMASFNQPSAMPSSMASHYPESDAVAAAKQAYDAPAGSMQNQMNQMHDQPAGSMQDSAPTYSHGQNQPAAMPSSMASHYRESSAVAKVRVAYDEPSHAETIRMSSNQSPSGLVGAITGFNNAFNRQSSTPKPVELSAFQNTQVQSPIARVPVPVHGSTPGTERNTLTKPPPVVVQDAGLAPQPVFRHSSQLNHDPNFRGTGTPNPQPSEQRLGLVPDQGLYHGQYQGQPQQYAGQQHLGQAPPIDRQLPALAPSLHIETVPSFPRGPPREASFWRRRKKALIIMLVCVLLGIGVGIVFVAQSFYKRWGGVGFLGAPVDITKRDAIVASRGHIGRRGFEHQKNGLEENKIGYLQAADGDVLAHQHGSEGKKAGKGPLEGMLTAGYKRGWGTDFKDNEAESSPIIPVKKVKHVTVIPVGSDARLTTPFASDFEIASTWWNARMNDMQKRGEEIIAAHPSPEDALAHAATLAQRFVDEIMARIEGNGLIGTCSDDSNGPSCPPCCHSGSSDVDMAMALASDYVDRVPVDAANDYDLDLLMESMDTSDLKRPAQEVAMLSAQGYIVRIPEDVTEMIETQSLSKRGVFSAEDVAKLMAGEDVPESVTVTVTKTRISTGAPTGLTPQEQAKQFASGYAEAVPHEDEGGYVRSKRSPKVISWDALTKRSAELDVMPWADLHVAERAAIASACAGIYGDRAPVLDDAPLKKRARTALQIAKHVFGKRDSEPDADVMPWAALSDSGRAEIASKCASIYSKAVQALDDALEAGAEGATHEKRSWSPYEVAMQMAGEYAKHVPDHAPASPSSSEVSAAPLSKRLPNGVPKEPAELIAAAFLGALKHDDAASAESEKRNAELYTWTTPKQREVAGRSWSPYEVAKQMAGEYAKAVPAKEPLSERHHGDRRAKEKRAWTPYEVAQQMAREYAKALPDHAPISVNVEVKEASEKSKRAWTPHEVAQQMAGEYAKAVPDRASLSKRAAKGDIKEPAELMAAAFLGGLKSEEDAGRWSDEELQKRKNVPFVTCGDHRKGCEAHGHPEICCPVLHTCHKSPTTNSGVICCPGNVDCSGSHTEVLTQAYCPPSTVACPVEASGGCCPSLDQCSRNGCLEFAPGLAPSNDPAKAHTDTRELHLTTTVVYGMNGEVLVPESTTITVTEQVGGKVSVTATVAKDGELASGTSLSAEQTYSDGTMIKPGSFKSAGVSLWMDTRWWGGRRAMVWRLVGVAALMSLM